MTTQTYDAASLRGRLHVSTKSFVIWALVGEDAGHVGPFRLQ